MAVATLLPSSFTFGMQQQRREGAAEGVQGCFAGEALAELLPAGARCVGAQMPLGKSAVLSCADKARGCEPSWGVVL